MSSVNHIFTTGRRRTWSTSCSSTTSQSSIASIYPNVNHGSQLAEPSEGYPTVYGSFTTTMPAALWLRTRLSLDIPASGKGRTQQPDRDCGDSPPDSPLSFFQSFSRPKRSPSISRTLTDFDWGRPSGPVTTSPPSPVTDNDDNSTKLHPILKALEKGSKLSCSAMCSACMKTGSNFPRCPRCDATWCSRECRLQGGKKHVCPSRQI